MAKDTKMPAGKMNQHKELAMGKKPAVKAMKKGGKVPAFVAGTKAKAKKGKC